MPMVTVAMPPFPAVLPFPGVPPLAVGFGASLGLPGGSIAGGFNVGPDGLTGGISGNFGPVSAGISVGTGGIEGVLSGEFGVAGNVSVGIGGVSANISGNLTGGLNSFGMSMISSLPPLLTDDEPGSLFQGPTWGIFDQNGDAVAPWESVSKIDYRHDMKVADFPIEDGGFASYNKVQMPYDVRISFVVGSRGGTPIRTQLLEALEHAVESLAFYTVATPEATYYRANLVHIEYARESRRGVNLLEVDVWVQEVRPAAQSSYVQEPKSPTAKPAGNNGQSQPLPVPPTPPGAPDHTMPSMLPGEPLPPPANMPVKSANPNPLNTGTSVVPTAPAPIGGQFTTPDPTALY